MNDRKPLTTVTKAKMDSNNTRPGYEPVYSCYKYMNTLTPEQLKGMNTGKWRKKDALRKAQLKRWKEISSSLILKGNISPPMRLIARSPEDWTLMAAGFGMLKNEISPPINQELIARRKEDWYQKVVDHNGTLLQTENLNAFYQDVRKYKPPLQIVTSKGYNAAGSYKAWIILLFLLAKSTPTTASPLPLQRDHHVKLGIFHDSIGHQNCTLKTDTGYFLCYPNCSQDSVQNQTFNSSSVQNLLKTFCEEQKSHMEINLMSLKERHSQSSDALQVHFYWELNKDGNVTNVTIRYICNDKVLTEDGIAHLPEAIFAANKNHVHMSPSEFMKEIKRHAVQLWERFRDPLLPFLEGATAQHTKSTGIVAAVSVIAAVVMVVVVILCIKYFGKKACKIIHGIFGKTSTAYSPAVQNELKDVANRNIESPA